ncbi:MAG: PAS domain-containing protein [Bacteroidetes bacterium]|jgi:photoactive yellow protein|nr:PAS domain-containing protein [Bacteroidota bacterium]
MPDPARDLYSFLRSKDFVSSDADTDADEDDNEPQLRAVDDFGDPDHDADEDTASDDLSFGDEDLEPKLAQADENTLNRVDFGVIRLDDDGIVQFFNRYESELSGVDPEDALGQNFFNELAPCSNNRLFRGRFKDGVRKGEMDERFTYTYTYKMRPTLVEVRLYRDNDGQNWIFVQKR